MRHAIISTSDSLHLRDAPRRGFCSLRDVPDGRRADYRALCFLFAPRLDRRCRPLRDGLDRAAGGDAVIQDTIGCGADAKRISRNRPMRWRSSQKRFKALPCADLYTAGDLLLLHRPAGRFRKRVPCTPVRPDRRYARHTNGLDFRGGPIVNDRHINSSLCQMGRR